MKLRIMGTTQRIFKVAVKYLRLYAIELRLEHSADKEAEEVDQVANEIDGMHAEGWISVEERLPQENGRYLVFMDKRIYIKPGEVRMGDSPFYNAIEIFPYYVTKMYAAHNPPAWEAKNGFRDLTKYITHWMPVPKEPRTGPGSSTGTEVPGTPGLYYL